jgi:thioredoxin-like negative regulator of GroEL
VSSNVDVKEAFERAQRLIAAGQLAEAEVAFSQLARSSEHRETALQALAQLYLQSQRPRDAVDILSTLHREAPDDLSHCSRLASLLDTLGETGTAISTYEQFLQRRPDAATGFFNGRRCTRTWGSFTRNCMTRITQD